MVWLEHEQSIHRIEEIEHKQETYTTRGFNCHWRPSRTAGLQEGRVWLLLWCHRKYFCYMTTKKKLSWVWLKRSGLDWVQSWLVKMLLRPESLRWQRCFFSLSPVDRGFRELGGTVGRDPEGGIPVTAVAATPCHVSGSCLASGITNTVMSSPEPSLSLGSRQPRSFSTPRDLISRSWAARVYLSNTQSKTAIKVVHCNLRWAQTHTKHIQIHI